MKRNYLLTCEHAGNEIPDKYKHLFKGTEDVLYTHKAIDFGALRLAQHLSTKTNLPLYYSIISRLLVEANRSLDSDELFSKYSIHLKEKEKQAILKKYYHPHRNQVEEEILRKVSAGNQVVHLAIHTFTPVMEGKVRKADIGILYDPKRKLEKELAQVLKQEIEDLNPQRKVNYNKPYPGTADGFPTYLRKQFSDEQYAGFEIEVNQKFFLNGDPKVWREVTEEFTAALKNMISMYKV